MRQVKQLNRLPACRKVQTHSLSWVLPIKLTKCLWTVGTIKKNGKIKKKRDYLTFIYNYYMLVVACSHYQPAWTERRPRSLPQGTFWLERISCPWWGWWCSAPRENSVPSAAAPLAQLWISFVLPETYSQTYTRTVINVLTVSKTVRLK